MQKSEILFAEAQKYIPGGVNSPVRAFKSVGGTPIYFKKGSGAYLFDEDGNKYIDFVGSWGPMLFGHANSEIINAIKQTIDRTLGFGAPTEIETELVKKIRQFLPHMELTRLVSSGTEATMSAIRIARGYTSRDKIIKFEGCYHGHSDSLLVKAGSGALTFGAPSSLGVPKALAELTITLEYNNSEQVKQVMSEIGNEIACIIVEPVAGNMNLIPGKKEFLQTLRDECDKHNSILIFDEVMSGFRVARGGATEIYNIIPDLTTLGKVIGGGLPVGAFGGKKQIMEVVAPLGGVYQAGTLSGNPLTVSAGLAMLELIENNNNIYNELGQKLQKLTLGIVEAAKNNNISMQSNYVGSMFGLFFTDKIPTNFNDIAGANNTLFNKFFHAMLKQGFYLAPSSFEAGFISTEHNNSDIDKLINQVDDVFKNIS